MIYDITQEVFSCKVYPGDTSPSFVRVKDLHKGDDCTVTDIHMCAHNGTHADAPAHFLAEGKNIDEAELSRFLGECTVRTFGKTVTAEDIAKTEGVRLLLKGECEILPEAAKLMCAKFLLVGVEMQSVGDASMHKLLLGADVALLEGLCLKSVPEGEYYLCALPLKLGGAEGAPVRAVLVTK